MKNISTENFSLKRSEIKKVKKLAKQITGKADCMIGGYFHSGADELGFVRVECEILSNGMNDREQDIILEVFMYDRRSSFAHI